MEFGVQDVYQGSALVQGKERKQDWAERDTASDADLARPQPAPPGSLVQILSKRAVPHWGETARPLDSYLAQMSDASLPGKGTTSGKVAVCS